jgi:hypothetical protein
VMTATERNAGLRELLHRSMEFPPDYGFALHDGLKEALDAVDVAGSEIDQIKASIQIALDGRDRTIKALQEMLIAERERAARLCAEIAGSIESEGAMWVRDTIRERFGLEGG